MTADHLGALICRGVGLLLLIVGAVSFLPAFFGLSPSDAMIWLGSTHPSSGWTSYAPLAPPAPATFADVAAEVGRILVRRMPYVLESLSGVILLFFSRPIGRLLARGLSDPAV